MATKNAFLDYVFRPTKKAAIVTKDGGVSAAKWSAAKVRAGAVATYERERSERE
jgi:hypothetical protein